MALVAAALADELKAMDLYDNEPEAIAAWAAAYKEYMKGATSNGVTIVPTALLTAETAMVSGLVGLKTSAATALQTGIGLFWGAIVPVVAWPTVTAITPPVLLSGLGAALAAVFSANTSGELSKNASMDAIAASIHTNSLGGIAAWPVPPGGVGPQPIL